MLILFKFANSLLSCDRHTFLFDELPGTKLFLLVDKKLVSLVAKDTVLYHICASSFVSDKCDIFRENEPSYIYY